MFLNFIHTIEYFAFGVPVYAATPTPTDIGTKLGLNGVLNQVNNDATGKSYGPINPHIRSIDTTLFNLLSIAISIAGLIALVIIIVAGFSYLTSSGDQQAIEKSKKTLTNGVIGLVIVMFAYVITQVVVAFFGLQGHTLLDFTSLFNTSINTTTP